MAESLPHASIVLPVHSCVLLTRFILTVPDNRVCMKMRCKCLCVVCMGALAFRFLFFVHMASLAVEPALDDPILGQAEVDLRWLADVYVVVNFFL